MHGAAALPHRQLGLFHASPITGGTAAFASEKPEADSRARHRKAVTDLQPSTARGNRLTRVFRDRMPRVAPQLHVLAHAEHGGGASFVDSAHACSGAASFGAFSPGVGGTLPARDVHALDANCVGAALSAVDAELGGACCGAKSSEYMSAGFAARALPGGGCGVLTGGGSAAAFDGAAKSRS